MKLCSACRHCEAPEQQAETEDGAMPSRCNNGYVVAYSLRSPVDGSFQFNGDTSALRMRTTGPCGWEARFWEEPAS